MLFRSKVTAVADSSGVALNTTGFDLSKLLRLKTEDGKAIDLPEFSSGLRTTDFAGTGIADILVESTPADMTDGGPGLSAARNALVARIPVVFANKAPLVFAFDELHRLADGTGGGPYEETHPVKIEYSATVCGGLPVVNVLRRDLRLAGIRRIRGVMNATTSATMPGLVINVSWIPTGALSGVPSVWAASQTRTANPIPEAPTASSQMRRSPRGAPSARR